jgi:hypothetical protein
MNKTEAKKKLILWIKLHPNFNNWCNYCNVGFPKCHQPQYEVVIKVGPKHPLYKYRGRRCICFMWPGNYKHD